MATSLSRERGIERKETVEESYPTGRYHKSVLLDAVTPKPDKTRQLPLLD